MGSYPRRHGRTGRPGIVRGLKRFTTIVQTDPIDGEKFSELTGRLGKAAVGLWGRMGSREAGRIPHVERANCKSARVTPGQDKRICIGGRTSFRLASPLRYPGAALLLHPELTSFKAGSG